MVNVHVISDEDSQTPSLRTSRKSQRVRGQAWDVGAGPIAARATTALVEPDVASAPPVLALCRPAYRDMDDVELLGHVVTGNDAAWVAFFRRFRGLVLSCAIKVSTRAGYRLGPDDLMDVLGDVSLNLVARNYHRLRLYRQGAGCTVASWIGVIATSTTRDYLRRARRHRLEPVADTELDRHASPDGGPDEILIDRQRRAFVDCALNKLSTRDRQFVELYFAEAMPPEDIATRMGVSLSTVYSKKAKIKTRLSTMARAFA